MNVSLERAHLLKSLGHVHSVVERRNTIPILSNVLLEADETGLKLSATDLDLDMVERAPATVSAPGATTVAAHTFFDIVRKLPDGAMVDLELVDGVSLKISAGRSRFKLACLPKEDFPVIAAGELPHEFGLSSAEMKRLIDKTRFAMSTEETRYYLNGIYLHVPSGDASILRAVSTDGHRLAQVDMPCPDGAAGMPGIIIPRKAVAELRKLIDDEDETINIGLSDTRIRFAFGGAVLSSKLIDGNFPDYSRVIPAGNEKRLAVGSGLLAEGVDRVSTIATDKSRAVKLSLDHGRLTLSVNSMENGVATEDIEAEFESDAFDIGFNARYLTDILSQIEGEHVEAYFDDSAAPTLVRDQGDERALYVLMPMRV
ncbi:MAG: DNA polymerase III subunit beta [Pseudomonadota bacterium]